MTFSVQSYDDPVHPYFVGRGRTVKVSGGVEFGLEPEGPQNGIDVVPVRVNIGPTRVEVDYSVSDPGILLEAKFNGYILRFETDCVLFQQARIDRDDTNMPLAVDAVSFDRGTLYTNGLRW